MKYVIYLTILDSFELFFNLFLPVYVLLSSSVNQNRLTLCIHNKLFALYFSSNAQCLEIFELSFIIFLQNVYLFALSSISATACCLSVGDTWRLLYHYSVGMLSRFWCDIKSLLFFHSTIQCIF